MPASPPARDRAGFNAVDFDLRGLATIRLLDATPADVAAVGRQLGLLPAAAATGEADLTIRFVDRLTYAGRLRYIGLDEAAFTDDAYLVLRGRQKSTVRAMVPVAQLGQPCELVCERGLSAVPLLLASLNLRLLAKGVLPLHASAFVFDGHGVLATGWAKGGKTETLLAFARHGARYVGDEWIYIAPEGRRMVGVPEPIRLWSWHLDWLPEVSQRLARAQRLRLRALGTAESLAHAASRRPRMGHLAARARPLLARQRWVQVPPADLFGPQGTLEEAQLDTVVFVVSHDAPEISVVPADPSDVARRVAVSTWYERGPLWQHYLQYRFAFPAHRNEILESAHEREVGLAEAHLADKQVLVLSHPYPVAIDGLFSALEPWLAAG